MPTTPITTPSAEPAVTVSGTGESIVYRRAIQKFEFLQNAGLFTKLSMNRHAVIAAAALQLFAQAALSQATPVDLGRLDPNMAVKTNQEAGIVWHSPAEAPFKLAGFAWFAHDKIYRRLPLTPSVPLPHAVDTLANHTSGGQIKFRSDSTRVLIKVQLDKNVSPMYHMAATGQFGFDLYIGEPGMQKYYSTAAFGAKDTAYHSALFQQKERVKREFTLNFPLYSGVQEVFVGLDKEALIEAPSPYSSDKPIVIYGGSTIQGACASRPGAGHMNIISRQLNMPVINLGFSGSGKLEPELAQIMAEIVNPAIYIIECERNSKYKLLSERQEAFVSILRQKHLNVPIMILTANPRGRESLEPDQSDRLRNWTFMHDLVNRMRKAGDTNIHFVDGSKMLGEDFYECSVDGTHPSDLGFYRMAQGLAPVLKQILGL